MASKFETFKIAIALPRIVRFSWNLVCGCILDLGIKADSDWRDNRPQVSMLRYLSPCLFFVWFTMTFFFLLDITGTVSQSVDRSAMSIAVSRAIPATSRLKQQMPSTCYTGTLRITLHALLTTPLPPSPPPFHLLPVSSPDQRVSSPASNRRIPLYFSAANCVTNHLTNRDKLRVNTSSQNNSQKTNDVLDKKNKTRQWRWCLATFSRCCLAFNRRKVKAVKVNVSKIMLSK